MIHDRWYMIHPRRILRKVQFSAIYQPFASTGDKHLQKVVVWEIKLPREKGILEDFMWWLFLYTSAFLCIGMDGTKQAQNNMIYKSVHLMICILTDLWSSLKQVWYKEVDLQACSLDGSFKEKLFRMVNSSELFRMMKSSELCCKQLFRMINSSELFSMINNSELFSIINIFDLFWMINSSELHWKRVPVPGLRSTCTKLQLQIEL